MSFADYPDVDVPPPYDDEPTDPYDVIRKRLVPGGTFILDAPDTVPAIWGEGDRVLWAEGEALIIAGPSGVGKTTLAGQLVRGLLADDAGDVLGLPVRRRRRVLYLAMDRPRQAARALRRTLDKLTRDGLDTRLMFWPGPPLADIARHPETLLALAHAADADVIVVDSVKDAAVGLSDDEVGAGYNRARQMVLAHGIDILELHHLVKRGANGSTPTALTDLYGSVWITAGAGSVVLLWGEAGDPLVELKHLKQPVEDVGPLKVLHDHTLGESTVYDATDLLSLAARPGGVTAKDAAKVMFDKDKPSPGEVEKARRKLRSHGRRGELREEAGDDASRTPARWFTTAPGTLTATLTAPENREPLTTPSRPSRVSEEPQVRHLTPTLTDLTPGDPHGFPPPVRRGKPRSCPRHPPATCAATRSTGL
ncbi:AAA family ATPase [Mobilicoccus caccae]|uniref:AAA+ ATPase domain-containing protein n=1 Tax=Mobilicoccus caccae TaxID=1859295 RepID=A0ABQ6IS74_9MICO|nr:AAA family ATPase [Mobilicoccus caccae]GMA40200.1 hypothetical protein GCM10025883_22450 [Mobilicoccus caccae]